MNNMRYQHIVLILILIPAILLACAQRPATGAPHTFTPLSAPPTAEPPTPAPPPTATAVPTPTAVPLPPTPVVDFDDLTPYKRAMLPQFQTDVDQVAARGASRYAIEVAIEPSSFSRRDGLKLTGVERIRYTNTKDVSLPEIYFRLYPNLPGYGGQMQVNTVIVNNRLTPATLAAQNSALRVPLLSPLPPGHSLDLSLFFTATVPTETAAGYNIFSYTNNTAALAGFYPAIAVFDQHGWDTAIPPTYGDATYLDTSLYQVKLTVPEPMVVVASGNLLRTQSNGDGTQTLSLVSGPMRDFYMALRPDFQVVSGKVGDVWVNSYFPPQLAGGGAQVLQFAVAALRVYSQRFGPYPYAEFDVVATPTNAGGVEYPGLVVAADRFYDNSNDFLRYIIAHETAHQWWYGLVGNNQITEPWLDEALTSYSAAIYWEDTAGQAAAQTMIENYFDGPYQQAKKYGHDQAVIGPVQDFSGPEYAAIVYGKGPLFFNALRHQLGDAAYFKVMQTYLARYKYGNVTAADFFKTVQSVSNQDIQPLAQEWLQNPHP